MFCHLPNEYRKSQILWIIHGLLKLKLLKNPASVTLNQCPKWYKHLHNQISTSRSSLYEPYVIVSVLWNPFEDLCKQAERPLEHSVSVWSSQTWSLYSVNVQMAASVVTGGSLKSTVSFKQTLFYIGIYVKYYWQRVAHKERDVYGFQFTNTRHSNMQRWFAVARIPGSPRGLDSGDSSCSWVQIYWRAE